MGRSCLKSWEVIAETHYGTGRPDRRRSDRVLGSRFALHPRVVSRGRISGPTRSLFCAKCWWVKGRTGRPENRRFDRILGVALRAPIKRSIESTNLGLPVAAFARSVDE